MSHNSVVLLATYNGEKYIRDIVLSVDPEIDIIVSDDLSSDSTVSIVKSLERGNISISVCDAGSAVNNFISILALAPLSYEYYFLADQDDVWCQGRADKVLGVMHAMELEYGLDVPLLVFSDAKVVDEKLSCISNSFWEYEKLDPNFSQRFQLLCVQNVGQGATIVFNRALLHKVRPLTIGPVMHDWWLMLCASAFGHISYTNEKTILYRQHTSNQVGAKKNNLYNLINMFLFFRGSLVGSIIDSQKQAGSFLALYREYLSDDDVEFLEEYSILNSRPFVRRKLFCLKYRLRKTSFLKTIGFYFLI